MFLASLISLLQRPRAFGFLVIVVASLVLVFACQRGTEQVKVDTIHYQVVEEWHIPAGGLGRTIVVDLVHVNERDLRSLGDQLRRESANDRYAYVYIFDDLAAARSRRAAMKAIINAEGSDFVTNFQKHRVGEYSKNDNTGYNVFYMFPEGYDGPTIKVVY